MVHTTRTLNDEAKRKSEIDKHIVTVEAVNPGERLSKGNIKVSCECGDYWSTWEVALKRAGAADIHYSNGEKPVVKNPSMRPGVCKHLYRMLESILTFNV